MPPGVVSTKSGDSPKARVRVVRSVSHRLAYTVWICCWSCVLYCGTFRAFLQPISCIPVSSLIVYALDFTVLLCCRLALLMPSQKLSEVFLSLGNPYRWTLNKSFCEWLTVGLEFCVNILLWSLGLLPRGFLTHGNKTWRTSWYTFFKLGSWGHNF